jgi:hypothetical protein
MIAMPPVALIMLAAARLGTARSRHTTVSSFAFFLRRCPPGTWLPYHGHAVKAVAVSPTEPRTTVNPVAHRISLVPLVILATPNPSDRPSFFVTNPLVCAGGRRCSRRLAEQAELTGGRRVYGRDDLGLKPLFPS